MSDATSNVDDVEQTDESSRSEYAEEVRSFQLTFAHELHRLADLADACSTFDMVMNDVGLPARKRHTAEGSKDAYGHSQYDYEGDEILSDIENEADAKRWALETSQALVRATDTYGYRYTYDPEQRREIYLTELLEWFGMPTRKAMTVRLTGTFDVEYQTTGWDDANLIENVSVYDVAAAVSHAITSRSESVQWKAQRPDADGNG